jgi:hypothetical protein
VIYELRTYTNLPAGVAEAARIRQSGYEIRRRHSPCLGYWMVEVGELNQTVNLWQYESFAHRTRVRAALAADPDWNNDYLARSRPGLLREDTMIMQLAMPDRMRTPPGPGVYELQSARLHSGATAEWLARFDRELALRRAHDHEPLAVWTSELGELDRIVQLWWYPDLDTRQRVHRACRADAGWPAAAAALHPLQQVVESKILIPTPFSPLP